MSFRDPSHLTLTRRRYRTLRERSTETGDAPTRLRRVVLTGGPGSGKSTAAAFLAREFTSDVWVLPEAATLLYKGGLPRGTSELGRQIAQRSIYGVQRSLEQAHGIQHPGRVLLCDRGTIDGAAYWPSGTDSFFRTMGTSREAELARYDAVIFLHTAAMLPAGYERDMEVRTEDRDEAIELDNRIFDLYRDHPRLLAIESQGSFLDKLTAVRNAVGELVQAPTRPGGLPAGVGHTPISALASLASVEHVLP